MVPLFQMNKDFTRTGSQTNEISFPLGGIGTGSIGLAGNGRLIDWEIRNRPNKLSYNGFSFFAIKAEAMGEVKLAKVLHGDLPPSYSGNDRGYGFGPSRESMSGMPHFRETIFKGEFPLAEITYDDAEDPLSVQLTAFNPFIPLNDKESSLPTAIFSFEVHNRSQETLDVNIVGNLTNMMDKGALNTFFDEGPIKGFKLHSNAYAPDEADYGDLTLSTDGKDISYQSYWYRGGWFDNLTIFWKEFSAPGRFIERYYPQPHADVKQGKTIPDVCLLSNHQAIAPGETRTFKFVISWNFPNCVNYWNPGDACKQAGCEYPSWKNYYTQLFPSSLETAQYIFTNLDRLYSETMQFKQSLFSSSLPDYIIDAISANLSILKSPTVLRLTDGTLYGFEGCSKDAGCCEGSCTHVWNYEQVTPFLFPALARSMREIDYKYTQHPDGSMAFRLLLPPERTLKEKSPAMLRATAADGQMGGIIKTYREWRISGDTKWLRKIWPQVKLGLEFAWSPDNQDGWDLDGDGVMEGAQHHTLDVEIYGPNSYISGLYHAALLAASEMADALGDEAGQKYKAIYENGRKWVDKNLFNGEYYYQQIDLQDDRFPIDPELGEIKYQIGEGCHIDQVLGQWHAHIVGLGYIFDKTKTKKALSSIYKYNFIECLRDYPNACRIYGLNDECGLLISTWPNGNSPKVPVPYADECMNGFEYQAACHMIYEGLIEEGLTCVKAVRHRYDGERRNPWNEFECGSNYARSMASYSLLLALSGFEYDTLAGSIGFHPKINREKFNCFWSLHESWGDFTHINGEVSLIVRSGLLRLNNFRCDLLDGMKVVQVFLGTSQIAFDKIESQIIFAKTIEVSENTPFRVLYI